MKGHPIPYSHDEMEWLEANRQLPIGEYRAAFVAAFKRDDVTAQHLHSLRKRKGWKTGRTGQFVPGQPAHNKGKPCAPGTGGRHPNAQRTQFRKGQRSGVAVKLWKPIGTERTTREGYLERKIHDGMPLQSRWRAVHLINWEAINGPIPAGHCLKCLDGNKLNTDPTNWELIPRTMLAHLNGGRFKSRLAFDQAPADLKPAIMAVARIKVKVRERA